MKTAHDRPDPTGPNDRKSTHPPPKPSPLPVPPSVDEPTTPIPEKDPPGTTHQPIEGHPKLSYKEHRKS